MTSKVVLMKLRMGAGFWTVTSSNVIFSRNRVMGPFMYGIDLDSSSSGNLVTNNYIEGCIWEGVFTECASDLALCACALVSCVWCQHEASQLLTAWCRPCHTQHHHEQHNHRTRRQPRPHPPQRRAQLRRRQ